MSESISGKTLYKIFRKVSVISTKVSATAIFRSVGFFWCLDVELQDLFLKKSTKFQPSYFLPIFCLFLSFTANL